MGRDVVEVSGAVMSAGLQQLASRSWGAAGRCCRALTDAADRVPASCVATSTLLHAGWGATPSAHRCCDAGGIATKGKSKGARWCCDEASRARASTLYKIIRLIRSSGLQKNLHYAAKWAVRLLTT